MKRLFQCEQCGGDDFREENGVRICAYCGAKFVLDGGDARASKNNPGIAVNSDVERLLEKCRSDPRNARKYANLVLDIDPSNQEALNYLRK